MTEKAPMAFERHSLAMGLVRDRFAFAICGIGSQGKPIKEVEVYDSMTNNWELGSPLAEGIANVSAIVMLQRYIYILGGENAKWHQPNYAIINFLDTGPS